MLENVGRYTCFLTKPHPLRPTIKFGMILGQPGKLTRGSKKVEPPLEVPLAVLPMQKQVQAEEMLLVGSAISR